MTILWSILILGGLGLVFGIGLVLFGVLFHVEEDERIKEVEKSFKPGMKLFNGHGKCFPVLKVTAKRVVLQGYSYSNGYPRKSEWIDNLARWIVNGSWTLQES